MNNTKTLKVAVTGVGGASGQGILKAMQQSHLLIDIIAVDCVPTSAGLFWPGVDHVLLPKPEEDIEAWKRWVTTEGINLIIPGADRDLPPLAAVAPSWRQFCRIAVSSSDFVQIADDKALTYKALQTIGVGTPASLFDCNLADALVWATYRYPVVIKPRVDAASRGMHVCKDAEELRYWFTRTKNPIVQEYLKGDEYTVSILFDANHEPAAKFVMRRDLYAGSTYRAEVVNDMVIDNWLDEVGGKLCRAFHPFGAVNLQFRVTDTGPKIFEINARCSGSTAIRAGFGYNEPEMIVNHVLNRLPITQPRTKTGYAFRFFEELIVPDATAADIEAQRVYDPAFG